MLMKTLFRRRRSLLGRFCPGRHAHYGPCCGGSSVQLTRERPDWSFCADPVTSAPTGPATVLAAWTRYGKVLVVGWAATPDARCTCSPRTSSTR